MPIIQVRDIQMFYQVHGQADGEPLILLHGFTSTGQRWDPFLEQLSQRYRLYVPDWRGHGRTTNPKREIVHAELAHDTAAFAHALGLKRAHFCGHSSGGMQLTFLALEQPKLVHSLTYVAATYTIDARTKALAREVAAAPQLERIESLRASHGEVHGEAYAYTIIKLWLDSVLRPDELPFTPDDLSRINCPCLIIHGDRDPFFPVDVPLTMFQAIPNAQLCILPQCGHRVPIESPTMFMEALTSFLGQQSMAS